MSSQTYNSAMAPSPTAQLIVQFLFSIKEVLQTMAGVTVRVGTPAIKAAPLPRYDVSGIIGFSGELTGSMVLSFHTPTAAAIVSRFAGVAIPPDSPDFAATIGKLANMILDRAMRFFGGKTSGSLPSIVLGCGHTFSCLEDVSCLVIPCHTPDGEFAVEVNIRT